MSYEIEDIEDGILAALRAYAQMPAEVRTIDSYQGNIEDLIKDLQSGVLPSNLDLSAILVCYAGSNFKEDANRSYTDEQYYAIACISENLRGKADVKAGMYQILSAVKKSLIDNNLGLDIEPLKPVDIDLKLALSNVSIFNVVFKTSYSI